MITIELPIFVGADTLFFCDGWARKNRPVRAAGSDGEQTKLNIMDSMIAQPLTNRSSNIR